MRCKAYVCVYLVLEENEKFLLSLRQNTGYKDGSWSMIAGHVEEGEGAIAAMIREAKEEADIIINKEDIIPAHVMYRCEDRPNIDIFMLCKKYLGEIRNAEPNKCGGLAFFSFDEFPGDALEYVKTAVENIKNNMTFSESFRDR
jgi:8-oxo-dGTP pyrophosphatase MutT (NUDIX family)